jgi:hypothetical protein
MAEHAHQSQNSDFRQYPLNIARTEVDADDLHLYNSELNRMSAALFVDNSTQCKVELWQATGHGDLFGKVPSQWRPSVSLISSLDMLQNSWKV